MKTICRDLSKVSGLQYRRPRWIEFCYEELFYEYLRIAYAINVRFLNQNMIIYVVLGTFCNM